VNYCPWTNYYVFAERNRPLDISNSKEYVTNNLLENCSTELWRDVERAAWFFIRTVVDGDLESKAINIVEPLCLFLCGTKEKIVIRNICETLCRTCGLFLFIEFSNIRTRKPLAVCTHAYTQYFNSRPYNRSQHCTVLPLMWHKPATLSVTLESDH